MLEGSYLCIGRVDVFHVGHEPSVAIRIRILKGLTGLCAEDDPFCVEHIQNRRQAIARYALHIAARHIDGA